jgi:hypothetical protein
MAQEEATFMGYWSWDCLMFLVCDVAVYRFGTGELFEEEVTTGATN